MGSDGSALAVWHAGSTMLQLPTQDVTGPVPVTFEGAAVSAMNFGSDNVHGVHDAILDAIRDANAGTARSYGHDDWSGGRRSPAARRVRVRPVGIPGRHRHRRKLARAGRVLPLARRSRVSPRSAHPGGRVRRAGDVHRRRETHRRARTCRQAHAGRRHRAARHHGPRRTRTAAERAVALAGHRARHGLHRGRGGGARSHGARPRDARAHGRRPLRQRARATGMLAGSS